MTVGCLNESGRDELCSRPPTSLSKKASRWWSLLFLANAPLLSIIISSLYTCLCRSLMTMSSAFCRSLKVECAFDLSFSRQHLRRARALTAWDQDENCARWSARLICSAVFVCNVCTFLTSGSPTGSSVFSFAGSRISFSHRNLGPVNQLDESSLFTIVPLDALSAGVHRLKHETAPCLQQMCGNVLLHYLCIL